MPPERMETTAECIGLSLVSERFPEEEQALQRLFQKSPSFQSLCADYRDCLAALKQWQESTSGEAPVMAGTYAVLLRELEQEAQQYLDDVCGEDEWTQQKGIHHGDTKNRIAQKSRCLGNTATT